MNPAGDVQAVVERILREECRVGRAVGPRSRLAEDLGLDSVGMLTLALELENHYQLRLGEDPQNPPRTVEEVVRLVHRRLEQEGRSG